MKRINFILRAWMCLHRHASKLTNPIPIGIWITNAFFQRILGLNGSIPWMVNFTSRVFGEIEIGKNVEISFALSGHCYVQALNGVVIGDDTIFAPGVKIISSNHDKYDLQQHMPDKSIVIGNNCWIGANAVILPGVQLGDNVIVGAGSIVTKSFQSNVVLAGNPARIISKI